jgi:hypothetical protein
MENKKITDRIINYWVLKVIFGPISLISLLAFWIGYHWPASMTLMQPIAKSIGLHHLVTVRTSGSEFESAVYLYWLVFITTLPLNFSWIYLTGASGDLFLAFREIMKFNLKSGSWNRRKYTLFRGYMFFILCIVISGLAFLAQLSSANEPSYCKDCEKSSIFGFILINWIGVHLILIVNFLGWSYLFLWKSIRLSFEGNNK